MFFEIEILCWNSNTIPPASPKTIQKDRKSYAVPSIPALSQIPIDNDGAHWTATLQCTLNIWFLEKEQGLRGVTASGIEIGDKC